MFYCRRFGTKCGGCSQGISPNDLVRRARNKVFHLKCFTCMVCRKQLSTGEELYVLDENKFICKEDYLASKLPGECYTMPYTLSGHIYKVQVIWLQTDTVSRVSFIPISTLTMFCYSPMHVYLVDISIWIMGTKRGLWWIKPVLYIHTCKLMYAPISHG